MASYREAYPSGRTSAYAAYPSSAGPPLHSHELLSRNKVFGHADHIPPSMAIRDPVAVLRSDLHVGRFPVELRNGALPGYFTYGDKQDGQAVALLGSNLGFPPDLRTGVLPGSLAYGALTPLSYGLCGRKTTFEVQGPRLLSQPHRLASDVYGPSSLSDPNARMSDHPITPGFYGRKTGFEVQSPMLPSQPHRLAMDVYGPSSHSDPNVLTRGMALSDYNIKNHLPLPHLETQPEQKPQTVLTGVSYRGKRKRETPSMEALIKETWDLHSLFRASAAASSSSDVSGPHKKQVRKLADVSHDVDPGGWWMEEPCAGESHEDITWSTPLKVLSPPKELSDPCNKEEQLAAKLQRSACEKLVQLMGNGSDDDGVDDESDEDSYASDDNDVLDIVMPLSQGSKSREEQAYNIFMEVFEDKELQKLYTEQCHVGKFECLVCSSMPGKPIKRYLGLVSVVMHASKIIKTKKKQEHRGFARAVCALLGWDGHKLPTVPPQGSTPQPRCCIPADGEDKDKDGIGAFSEDCKLKAGGEGKGADVNV